MIKEAIDKIQALAITASAVQQFDFDGRTFTDRPLHPLQPAQAAAISLETLTGLVDFIEDAKAAPTLASGYFLHIVNYARVEMVSIVVDEWGRRITAAVAECKNPVKFNFGNYIGQEAFIIGLLANFIPSDERDALIRLVATIAATQQIKLSDDGLAQEVETKSGMVLKNENPETTPRRLKLKPYRTFRDVDQPESEFILRVKADNAGVPALALFEADGESWKLEAVAIIRRWLATTQIQEPVLPVVA